MPSFKQNGIIQRWPENVGIIDMEVYFPSQCVKQTDLEVYDNNVGKYTIGLGQSKMGFCDDREDIHSLCLTVLARLMDRTNVGYENIGRLEVGTETIIDKSKSVKSVLMKLFEESGNLDIEGVDTTNACYGGTAALFNAINWIESSSWEVGKYAIVITGDIAVYAKGAARPTGGAGAIAMLIGPDAPLVIERGIRSSYMKDVYDFYKPNMSSEYAVVDGELSVRCYFTALDKCYQKFKKRASDNELGSETTVNDFDAILFHSPYCKLVQKSLARLVFNDFLQCPSQEVSKRYPGLEQFRYCKLEDTYFDKNNKDIEKAFLTFSRDTYEKKTKPSLLLSSEVGNMYTPSLYGGLASLLALSTEDSLAGKRIALFSYGSGLAASFFSIKVTDEVGENSPLRTILRASSDIPLRLNERIVVTAEDFTETLNLRETTHNKAPYQPTGNISKLFPGTFYLSYIDDKYRRVYGRAPSDSQDKFPLSASALLKNGARENVPFTNGHSVEVLNS